MRGDTEKIFVQIPSYRDRQLVPTIESLLSNAACGGRLVIWVCWQHGPGESIPRKIRSLKNVHIISYDYRESNGAGWAKSILQKKWSDEPYSLLVDSHTRFVKHWDRKLIDMMRQLKNSGTAKPVISSLPPPFYDPGLFPKKRMNYPLKIYPKHYEHGLLTRFCGHPVPLFRRLKSPLPAQFIAMGFLFTEGYFNREIPVDPHIYFFGDDITTAIRAYSFGYDFFHPHRVIAWHLYERDTRTTHWDDNTDWYKTDRRSYRRVLRILKGEQIAGYPTGNIRNPLHYEAHTGYKLIYEKQD